jgi:hypothetical protein
MYFHIAYSLSKNIGVAANHNGFIARQFLTTKVGGDTSVAGSAPASGLFDWAYICKCKIKL